MFSLVHCLVHVTSVVSAAHAPLARNRQSAPARHHSAECSQVLSIALLAEGLDHANNNAIRVRFRIHACRSLRGTAF